MGVLAEIGERCRAQEFRAAAFRPCPDTEEAPSSVWPRSRFRNLRTILRPCAVAPIPANARSRSRSRYCRRSRKTAYFGKLSVRESIFLPGGAAHDCSGAHLRIGRRGGGQKMPLD